MDAANDWPKNNNTLLIVDDNPADRELFCQLILQNQHASPFSVLEASSCNKALEMIASHQPSCCLVDYQLPVNNGLEFLKSIRRMEYGESIPVIIMTGEGDERIAVEMMRNGAQDYLVKHDITSQSLIHSITNAIHTCELQTKLRHLAHYDNLTGLLNRSLFLDRLQTAIDQCDRYGQTCSLLYIDVDNFKQVNDQYGHDAGDVLLKAIGERVKLNCRMTDSAARLGGDEFAILLSHINETDTNLAAEKILNKVSEPVLLESQSIHISLSIGIAHYPYTAGNLHELMRQADEAMYRAKKTGKARYFRFTREQKEQWERKNALETMLPKALENNDFKLAFQPIINAQDQSLHSLEVLVRWFPEGYDVTATEMIEMIERLGLFDPYHVWLINTSLQQLHQWQKMNPDLHVCLNIPANQCHSDLVVDCLRKAMETYRIQPEQIELEITETTLMKHPTLSTKLLQSMQGEGVRIAIDDFGAGYSSMSYLTTLPLNTLKIDQKFFIGMEKNNRNRKVVDAVTALGHSLGLQVVAEGVETEAQYQMAREIGCDYIQGFYFGRPQLGDLDWKNFADQFPVLSLADNYKAIDNL
ncbi:MAG: two-component system response regulator [Cellvibrionaceae bacterium]